MTSEYAAGDCVDHWRSSARIHCTRTGLPDRLRQDHGLVLGAGVAAVRPAVVARPADTHARRRGRSWCRASSRSRRAAPAGSDCACGRARCRRACTSADRHRRADRRVLHVRQLVGGRQRLGGRRERRADVALVRLALRDRRRLPVGVLADACVQLRVARQALPLGPLRVGRDLLAPPGWLPTPSARPRRRDCPSRRPARSETRVLSSWPADTSVEPSVFGCTTRACSMPGRRTSVDPGFLRGDLRRRDGVRERLADDRCTR